MTRLHYAPLFLAIGGALHPVPMPTQSLNDLLTAITGHWIEAQRVETLRATLADMERERATRPPGPANHAGYVLDPSTATAEDVQAALGFRPRIAPADMLDHHERSETELSSTPETTNGRR